MRTLNLTILQLIPPPHLTKPNLWPKPQTNHRQTPHTCGAKGFTGRPEGGEPVARKGNTSTDVDDDKIPDVVWERMISRILFSVGVPLAIGFAFLRGFDVVIENKLWDVPKWLPFLTTFITFGASALGIAYGSLSTSLNAAEKGSFLGVEQVQRNWVEMWKEEDAA